MRRPIPSKENRLILERAVKGMISAHPSYQGIRRSDWDPETFSPGQKSRAEARPTGRAVSRERLGHWDGPIGLIHLVPAQACHMAKRRVGVEYSQSLLEPVRPGAVLPDRALYLPTFSHLLIVNKLLSLS